MRLQRLEDEQVTKESKDLIEKQKQSTNGVSRLLNHAFRRAPNHFSIDTLPSRNRREELKRNPLTRSNTTLGSSSSMKSVVLSRRVSSKMSRSRSEVARVNLIRNDLLCDMHEQELLKQDNEDLSSLGQRFVSP